MPLFWWEWFPGERRRMAHDELWDRLCRMALGPEEHARQEELKRIERLGMEQAAPAPEKRGGIP